jgi:hypothetical protein
MKKNENPQSQELREDIEQETITSDTQEPRSDETLAENNENAEVNSAEQADASSADPADDNSTEQADDNSVEPADDNSVEPADDNSVEPADANSVESEVLEDETGDFDGGAPADAQNKKIKRDTRRLRYGGMATALTAVVVAVVILVNVVAGILNDRFPFNFDLTAEKLFTLSSESKTVAKSVKKDTEIVVFAEESIFTSPNSGQEDLNKIFKQFHETTKQLESLSGGRIKTKYVDLVGDPTQATKYAKYEVNQGEILFICGNRWQKANTMDLLSFNEEAYNYYGQLTDVVSKVENVLTINVAMVTSDKTPHLTVLTGHDEDGELINSLKESLGNNNFKLEDLNITGSAEFNDESVVAIIPAPSTDYTQNEIDRLRKWLSNDGKFNRHLAVFVDYKADCPELYKFLNVEYGVEVTDNLVFESDANRMFNYYPHYIFGDIEESDFTGDILDEKVLMPVVRQILTNKENDTNSSLFNVDVITFPESSKLVSIAQLLDESNESYDDIKKVDAKEYPVIGLAYANKWGYQDNERYNTYVMVSGCSAAFISDFLSLTMVENEGLLLSAFNGFTGNESPVTISSKSLQKTMLEFTTGQQNTFFMIFVAIIPIALIITCLAVFIRRRRL